VFRKRGSWTSQRHAIRRETSPLPVGGALDLKFQEEIVVALELEAGIAGKRHLVPVKVRSRLARAPRIRSVGDDDEVAVAYTSGRVKK